MSAPPRSLARTAAALLALAAPLAHAVAQAGEAVPTQPMPPGGWPGAPNDPMFYPRWGLALAGAAVVYGLVRGLTGWRFPREWPERRGRPPPPPAAAAPR